MNLITDIMGKESKKSIPSETKNPGSMPPQKKYKKSKDLDDCVHWDSDLSLRVFDQDVILMGQKLKDKHNDIYQKLLKPFQYIKGLSSTVKLSVIWSWVKTNTQVYHYLTNH